MITVWGRNNSVNVQKVMWAAAELGLEVERHDVGGPFGGNREADYLARNPTGLVPTMQDGDVVLWESNTIVRYLAARYGEGSLYPTDPGERGRCERWMDWQLAAVNVSMSVLFRQLIRTPAAEQDAATIARTTREAGETYTIADGHLAGRDVLELGRLTIADIPVAASVHRFMVMDIARPDLPNLSAYYQRMTERPGYREHVMLPLS